MLTFARPEFPLKNYYCIGLENPSPRGSLISKICCLVKSQAMDPSSKMGIIIHHALLNEAGSILPLGESLYR